MSMCSLLVAGRYLFYSNECIVDINLCYVDFTGTAVTTKIILWYVNNCFVFVSFCEYILRIQIFKQS